MFPDDLENFQTAWAIWNVSRRHGNFPDYLESFESTWKISRQPGKFLLHKRINVHIVKTMFTLFEAFLQNDLRTLS